MKTIKALSILLLLMFLFTACEESTIKDEVGIEINDEMMNEDHDEDVVPEEEDMPTKN